MSWATPDEICPLEPVNIQTGEDFHLAAWANVLDDRPRCQMSRVQITAFLL